MNLAYARFFHVFKRDSYDNKRATYAGLHVLFPGLCKNERVK